MININSKLSKKSLKKRSLKLKNKSKVFRKNVKNMRGGKLTEENMLSKKQFIIKILNIGFEIEKKKFIENEKNNRNFIEFLQDTDLRKKLISDIKNMIYFSGLDKEEHEILNNFISEEYNKLIESKKKEKEYFKLYITKSDAYKQSKYSNFPTNEQRHERTHM
jgi:hypothetical protein